MIKNKILLLSFLLFSTSIFAKSIIIASVGDFAITSYDLNNFKKISKTAGNYLEEYILLLKRRLIAIKAGITLTKKEKELLYNNKDILKDNGIIDTKDVSKDFINFILESNYLWARYIEEIVKPNILINENYINDMIEYISKDNIKTKYNISEIVLYFNSINKNKTIDKINKIYKNLNTKNFSSKAESLSESTTSKDGGNIGWIFENDLNENISNKIKNSNEGDILEPICDLENSGSCSILKINKKEKILEIPDQMKLQIRNFIYSKILESKLMYDINNTEFSIEYYDYNKEI